MIHLGTYPLKGGGLVITENVLLAAGFDNLQLTDSYQDNAPKLLSTMHLENNNLYGGNNDDFQSYGREHSTFYNRNNYHPIINQPNPCRTNQQIVLRFQPHSQYAF